MTLNAEQLDQVKGAEARRRCSCSPARPPWNKVIEALKPFGPTIVQTNLTKDREDELVQALQS